MELKFDIDPMIDSAIDNIKDAMGSWDMNSVRVEVSIKHESRIIAYERFYIDETKKIADFIKKHIIFN